MKIILGSKNKAKQSAVKLVYPTETVETIDVPSFVSDQPFSDKETLTGAINRANEIHKQFPNHLAIGLEGGVMRLHDHLFLCNWGALVDPHNQLYIASGARIPLPSELVVELDRGQELGRVIDSFANKIDVRQSEGTIGILTENIVTREEMFAHVVKQLKGQYLFYQKTMNNR